jgi:manganese transport protein
VMQGFVRRRIPLFLRRLITMVPALLVLGFGVNPTEALVDSQVVLSFGIPFALVPLLIFCADRGLMQSLANSRVTTITAAVVVASVVLLNAVLLLQIPGISFIR